MEYKTNRNSILRMITSGLAVINMIVITLGGDAINIADDKLYVIASCIALVVTVVVGVYKHNATSPLGCLIRDIYDTAKKYGVDKIYEVIVEALETFIDSAEEDYEEDASVEDPDEDEVLPQ